MPELPEVETVRRSLAPVVGARIVGVWDSAKGLHMRRKPPRARLKKLVGATITEVRRHGKYLLVDTDGPLTLLIHLGMTGRVLIQQRSAPRPNHTHVVLDLGARELRFADARRFGQIDVLERSKETKHAALADLGPDPIVHGIDVDAFAARAKGKKATLKAFLLDQTVLAGVGNIYASEALWRAQLKPTTRAHRLTAVTAAKLAAAIDETLRNALDNGGTTFSDFIAADGAEGYNEDYLWVYGRAGEPCLRCKTLIKRAVHQGRVTYYCPTCQAR
ncbi:MAG TPA: bifunctional DNA-formamidopyrimidine glycosylase/DNA-(apurinic or apyrimidinic site) lyase [Kofleriaceae bacterium]|nr:bifunctional DNA-formamidopyrimidine glycosylase/DNA-(apurinic or apyrimidinic site) lyase [Kofleriaceae bacterium]